MALRRFFPAAMLLAATSALAQSDSPPPLSADALAALAGRVAGAPVECVEVRRIQSTRLYDTIVIYKQSSRLWYVNRPDGGRCTALRANRAVATRLNGPRLCRGDLIGIFQPTSSFDYGTCTLGAFIPFSKP